MNDNKWKIQQLDSSHIREGFDCGEVSLNDFLIRFSLQNIKKNICRTYVAIHEDDFVVKGYYGLSTQSISFEEAPQGLLKGLPKYPIPTAHIGQLAVSLDCQRCGLGALLLADAIKRIHKISLEIGLCAVTVKALNEKSKEFYVKFGFDAFDDNPLLLFKSIKTIKKYDYLNG